MLESVMLETSFAAKKNGWKKDIFFVNKEAK